MREVLTVPTGETVTVLTGAEAVTAMLEVARECAERGGVVAAEVLEDGEG